MDDVAHFPAECSNKGICNRKSGKCECEKGFTGDACERSECWSHSEVLMILLRQCCVGHSQW